MLIIIERRSYDFNSPQIQSQRAFKAGKIVGERQMNQAIRCRGGSAQCIEIVSLRYYMIFVLNCFTSEGLCFPNTIDPRKQSAAVNIDAVLLHSVPCARNES